MSAPSLHFISPKGTKCWLTVPDINRISIFYVDSVEHARFQVVQVGNQEQWRDEKGQLIPPKLLGKTLFAIAQSVDDQKK